jgi:hypothetical protein
MKFIGSHELYENWTKSDQIDCPLITYNNAIVYDLQSKDYQKSFKVPDIREGLILDNGKYFFFFHNFHNIVSTPHSNYVGVPLRSWDIYQITTELAAKIIVDEKVHKWDVVFDTWINVGHFYNYVSKGKYIDIKKYPTYIVGDTLYGPYGFKPSEMGDGENIEKFLYKNKLKYNGQTLLLNKTLMRDMIIESLI